MVFKDLSNTRADKGTIESILLKLSTPGAERLFYIGDALRAGISIEEIYKASGIDRWFLHNIKEIIDLEKEIINNRENLSAELLSRAKQFGFSDRQLAQFLGKQEEEVYKLRSSLSILPAFKLVDTCAAEFKAFTPYYYSTYDN